MTVSGGKTYLHDLTHHRLVVVLQGHSDHVEADDESDEDVQIVAGADRMDKEAYVAVGSIVRQTLRLFSGKRDVGRVRKKSEEREKWVRNTEEGEGVSLVIGIERNWNVVRKEKNQKIIGKGHREEGKKIKNNNNKTKKPQKNLTKRRNGEKYIGKKTKNRILGKKSVSLCLWEWC